MEALLCKYLGKKEEPKSAYATILHDARDHSIEDLMSYSSCSSMEYQLYGSTSPTLEECSTCDGEADSPSESPQATKVIASMETTTTMSLSVNSSDNLVTNGMCFMAKATEVYPKPKSRYVQT